MTWTTLKQCGVRVRTMCTTTRDGPRHVATLISDVPTGSGLSRAAAIADLAQRIAAMALDIRGLSLAHGGNDE